jgi:secretion/DNA translocation related TadE-like protein
VSPQLRAKERGAATVVMTALLALAVIVCVGVARLGAAAVASARADAAADAAALAAADMLALDRGIGAAQAAARETAGANGARLTRCACSAPVVTVTVVVRAPVLGSAARANARAEVRAECRLGCPDGR